MRIHLLGLMVVAAMVCQGAEPLAERLQKGLFEEEANHDLTAAIGYYEGIVKAANEQRRIVATALYRLAECYRKLGRTEEAKEFLARVAREFPEQKDIVERSANQLIGTAPSAVTADDITASAAWIEATSVHARAVAEEAQIGAALEALKEIEDGELQSILPTLRRDPALERSSQNLIRATLQFKKLESDLGAEHPEMVRLRSISEVVLNQVKGRVAGILTGLQIAEKQQAALKTHMHRKITEDSRSWSASIRQAVAEADFKAVFRLVIQEEQNAIFLRNNLEALKPPTNLRQTILSAQPDPVIEFLEERLLENEQELVSLKTNYAEEHPEVRKVKDALQFLDDEMRKQIAGVMRGLEIRARMHEAAAKALRELQADREKEFQAAAIAPSKPATEKFGDLARLLDNSPDLLNAPSTNGVSFLQHAAIKGDLEMIDFLVKRGALLQKETANSSFPLYLAVQQGHWRAAATLIKAGAQVNARTRGEETALHEAARRGFKAIAELLLANGAELDARDHGGFTPLHYAVNSRQVELVAYLAGRGADLKAKETGSGRNALMLGVRTADAAMVHELLKAGADPNEADASGLTPIFLALRHEELIKALLGAGADANAKDKMGNTPLFYVTGKRIQIGDSQFGGLDVRALRLLLTQGANPNAKDKEGRTPMHSLLTIAVDPVPALSLLLEANGDANAVDGEGKTLLDYALRRPEAIELLEKFGAKTPRVSDAEPPKEAR